MKLLSIEDLKARDARRERIRQKLKGQTPAPRRCKLPAGYRIANETIMRSYGIGQGNGEVIEYR